VKPGKIRIGIWIGPAGTDGAVFVLLILVPLAFVIGIGFSIAAIIRARREAREGAGGPTRSAPFAALGSFATAIVLGFGNVVLAGWFVLEVGFRKLG
jgi:hypothetical protein